MPCHVCSLAPATHSNQQRRSLSGFRMSVLIGWLAGDTFKTVYFLAQGSPIQFTGKPSARLSMHMPLTRIAVSASLRTLPALHRRRHRGAGLLLPREDRRG